MKTALTIMAGVVFTHYLVKPIAFALGDPPGLRAWLQYTFNGAMDTALFLILIGLLKRQPMAPLALMVGLFFCYAGAFESSQIFVCGMASIGTDIDIPFASSLCLERFGPFPYAALAAFIAVLLWRNHARPH